MDALAKKRLRTLQLTDWASVIEDINYNFSVLLSSPLFVGLQGDTGAQGSTGPAGVRGSKWMFVDVDNFRVNFPDDSINGAFDITQQYLTAKLQNASARQALIKALGAGTLLVDGDVIVSNSRILMVDLENNVILDTGESINGNQDVFMQTMQKQIKSLVDEYLRNNTDLDNIRQTVSSSASIAKNYEDSSSLGINNTFHKTSILDIPMGITQTDTGVVREANMLFYPSETIISESTKLSWIFGSRERYHDIVQKQLSYSSGSTSNTTSEYSPNDTNQPALIILQNDNRSGAIIGSKNAKNFTEFGRWYMNGENKMVITSSWMPEKLKCSQLIIGNDDIELVSSFIKLLSDVLVSGNLTIKDGCEFISQFLKVDKDGRTHTGQPGMIYEILSDIISLPNLTECEGKFLTLKNGIVAPAAIQLLDVDETVSAIPDDESKIVTSNYLIWLIRLLTSGLNTADIGGIEGDTCLFERLRARIANLENISSENVKNLTQNVNVNTKTITQLTRDVITNSAAISNNGNQIKTINSNITNLGARITEVTNTASQQNADTNRRVDAVETDADNKITSVKKELDGKIQTVNSTVETLSEKVSTLSTSNFHPIPGTIIDLWVDTELEYTDLINKLFNTNGQGKDIATYTVMGKSVTTDLSEYYICDGRSGAPDLTGVILAMASAQHKASTYVGTEKHLLSNDEIPAHKHKIVGSTYDTTPASHAHAINLETSEAGDHTHDVKYKKLARFGSNQGDAITYVGEDRWSGVLDGSGNHKHIVSGTTNSDSHYHTLTIPEQETTAQHEITQKEISVMQPTKYCLKLIYVGK